MREAAEILDITSYLDRKPKALSGGQRQRVAIGRAIVRNPQVFLMDEPLSNLDAKLRNQMRAEIIKLRQRIDTTFIYVTHDQTEAMTLGDRIVIMKDGYIQQIGTPQEVFEHPANIFVAGFIGTPQMNLFDAKLVKTGGGYQVEVCGAMMPLSEKIQQGLADKGAETRPVTLGIRPEHIHLQNGAWGAHHLRQGGRVRDDGQRDPPARKCRRQGCGTAHPHYGAGGRAAGRYGLRHRVALYLP